MKIRIHLLFIAILFPCICFAQWHEITTNNGSTTVSGGINNSRSSATISKNDIWPDSNKSSSNRNNSDDRDHDRDTGSSEPLYGDSDGSSSDGSWGVNDTYSNELYQTLKYTQNFGKYDKLDAEEEATSSFKTMNKLLTEDCIDYLQIINAIDDFNSLSDYQKRLLGNKGKTAREKLLAQLEKGKPFYDKYSLMAKDIKNNSFSSLDPEIMRLPYESLDRYLRLFISMEEFEKAQVEYGKYEKNRTVKRVYDKVRYNEMQKKSATKENDDLHLSLQTDRTLQSLQKVRLTYAVGAMAVTKVAEAQNQFASKFDYKLIPKSELLDEMTDGINTIDDIGGLFVKAFLGDNKGAFSDYKKLVKRKAVDPLVSTVTNSFNTLANRYSRFSNCINDGKFIEKNTSRTANSFFKEILNAVNTGDVRELNRTVDEENKRWSFGTSKQINSHWWNNKE